MSHLSQPILLLLLLGSALTFRMSQHHVHKKDGHDHDLESDRSELRQAQDNMQREDTENSIPGDIEISFTKDTDISEGPGAGTEYINQEDTTENDMEDRENNKQKDTEDINQEKTKANNQVDTKEIIQDETENNDQEDSEDNNLKEVENISQKDNETSISCKAGMEVLSNTCIAFLAELSFTVEIASGSTIVFDKVRMNEGGLYNGTSGKFYCTDEGAYVFMWTLVSAVSARGLGALAFGEENIKAGPQTNHYSTDFVSGNTQMVSVVQCRLSPITAVTVLSMHTPVSTYYREVTSFAGFRLSPDAASAVAFTAELSKNVSLFPGTRIMFDHVVSNLGGHYDSLNGFFRCPDNGVYSISVSAYYPKASNQPQWSVSRLMFNRTSVLQGPMTYRATTYDDSGSSSVTLLVECKLGRDFYVEAAQSFDFVYTEYGPDLTSFSGFRLCSQCDDMVAFSAVLTQNVTTSGVDIRFDTELINLGDAYNLLTGVFTCPDDALYMFQWSVTSIYGNCYIYLFVNDSDVKWSYMTKQSSSTSYGTSGTSSQSAVIRCSAGDTVSLRGDFLSSSRRLLAGYSTFSGYRLPGQ